MVMYDEVDYVWMLEVDERMVGKVFLEIIIILGTVMRFLFD